MLARCEVLNQQIQEANAEKKREWEAYVDRSKKLLSEEQRKFEAALKNYTRQCEKQQRYFSALHKGYEKGTRKDVIDRFGYVLGGLSLPASTPRIWDFDFDEDQGILIAEVGLPDIVHRTPFKLVNLKSGPARKPLNQTEKKEFFVPRVHPAILLRIAYELFRNDSPEVIKLLVVNGWVRFDDPRTGADTKAYPDFERS